MKNWVNYGNEKLSFSIPYRCSISELNPNQIVPDTNSHKIIEAAIDNSIGTNDVMIGIGNIVPDGSLGWSGRTKILFPGVTSENTFAQSHMKAAMLGNSNFDNVDNKVCTILRRGPRR